jgi:quinol monooxygenase YgiN
MSEGPLRVVARINAKSDKIGEVRKLLSALVEPTRKERGCLTYELLQNRDDPADFTFVEEWASDSTFDSHSTADHIKALTPKLQPMITEPPDIRIYSLVE